jgi:hypothetical protein
MAIALVDMSVSMLGGAGIVSSSIPIIEVDMCDTFVNLVDKSLRRCRNAGSRTSPRIRPGLAELMATGSVIAGVHYTRVMDTFWTL